MKKLRITIVLILLITKAISVEAQSAKELYKTGLTLKDNGKYEEAASSFTQALKMDATIKDAYGARAFCYEKLGNLQSASEDYKKALLFDAGNTDLSESAANVYMLSGNYKDAIAAYYPLCANKKKALNAYKQLAFAKIKTKDFKGAQNDADVAINMDADDFTANFYKGIALDSLGDYATAVKCYERAIVHLQKDKKYKDAINKSEYKFYYINPGISCGKLKQNEEAIKYFNTAESIASNDFDVIYTRALFEAGKGDVAEAKKNFGRAISINGNNANSFVQRGLLNNIDLRYTDALSDFSRAIVLDSKNVLAYKGRGITQRESGDLNAALSDFETASKLSPNDNELKELIKATNAKILELHKESNKPELEIEKPAHKETNMFVPENTSSIKISGIVKDESGIALIKINDVDVPFDKSSMNPKFSSILNISNVKTINISVSDIYQNNTNMSYNIIAAETTPPTCELVTPTAINNTISINSTNNYKMYIEGKAIDNSLIQSVTINGKAASFDANTSNPTFTTTIETAAIDTIKVSLTDVYGNNSITKYIINRNAATASEANPMGKTWVVFIENSNYSNLPSLEAVTTDVSLIKKALIGYIIDSVITRKNMTKASMEKFFSIELRNMIASGQVSSLLIWYSGHGKVTNDNGYFLPIDANKKDEFTFFSTTNLKGYLGTYKDLRHTLVITDATETGPAFYLAMRDTDKPRECGDYQATKLKSAQVLSAAEAERTNESSTFSKAFANTLTSLQDKCISIDKISDKVSVAAKQNQKQKPRFGNIQDLNDENGTFFFIKK